jgi:hypothetical protein
MRFRNLAPFVLAALLGVASPARAESPPLLPVQGALYDADGLTIDETVTMTFALYDAVDASTPLWTEVQAVAVRGGAFSAYLGTSQPLDLVMFAERADIFVGITVEDDVEMPRIRIATAPYAAWADRAGDSDTVGGFTTDDLVDTTIAEADLRYEPLGAATPWGMLSGIPAGFADEIDDDTLGVLGCDAGEFPVAGALSWECEALPAELADGDSDVVAALGCGDGEYPAVSGGLWTCATLPAGVGDGDDDTLAELGCTGDQYAVRLEAGWGCTTLPDGIADGDNDLLASLACGSDEYAARIGGTWGCAPLPSGIADGDNDLLASLACADNEYAARIGGTWGCAALTPDIADGDNDLLAALACTQGQYPAVVGGAWTCASLAPGFADGVDNDSFGAYSGCPAGQVLKSNGPGVGWTCAVDNDVDTDTRCDTAGRCSQVCIGSDCRTAWPTGAPVVAALSQNFTGPSTYTAPAGTPLSLSAVITTYGGSNCAGIAQVRWLNAGGGEVLGWTTISGTNAFSGGDGGSGMYDVELATIPFVAGSTKIEFRGAGCHGYYSANLVAVTYVP